MKLNMLTYWLPRILRPHSEPQPRRALTRFSCWQSPVLNSQRTQIAELAVKSRLPAIYDTGENLWKPVGLCPTASSIADLDRRAATYVDKILKGSKARRFARRAADEVRAGDQSEDGEPDRPDDSAGGANRAYKL